MAAMFDPVIDPIRSFETRLDIGKRSLFFYRETHEGFTTRRVGIEYQGRSTHEYGALTTRGYYLRITQAINRVRELNAQQ